MIDFSHASYLHLLGYVKGLGYPIGPFRDFRPSGPYMVLRHDIDYSVTKAMEMAALDCEAGVRSTFFVLLTSPYYNALSEDNVRWLTDIADMGHEIGLHYDCAGFEKLTSEEQLQRIRALAACVEDNLKMKVTAISQHRPAAANIKPEFPGYVDAYSPPFFKDMAYISDSRMVFRVSDVYAFFKDNPRSQVLIHPVWWHAQPKTRDEVFAYIEALALAQLRENLQFHASAIREFLKRQSGT